MASTEALQRAAQAWCSDKTKDHVMDTALAEAFADILDDEWGTNKVQDLANEIAVVLNKFSRENASNTPDFILAEFLHGCLESFERATKRRDCWYGREER